MSRIVPLVSLVVVLGCSWRLAAQEVAAPRPDAADSLDAKLLENLGADLLEGLDETLPKPMPAKSLPSSPRKGDRPPPTSPPDERPQDAIGEDVGAPATAADEENVLARIEQKMRDVERRLALRDPSDETQSLQRQIAEELAALLEQLQQQQQQSQSQSSQQQLPQPQTSPEQQGQQSQRPTSAANPSSQPARQPARDSEERTGKVDEEKIRPEEIQDLIQAAWGHLPPQVRLRMEDAASEQFLPRYQTLIEDYFRRLAEERRR